MSGEGMLGAGSEILLPAGTIIGYYKPTRFPENARRMRLQEDAVAEIGGDQRFYRRSDGTFDFGARQPELKLYNIGQRGSAAPLIIRMRDPETGDYESAHAGDRAFIWTSSDPWTVALARPGTVMPPEPPVPLEPPAEPPAEPPSGERSSLVPIVIGSAAALLVIAILVAAGKS